MVGVKRGVNHQGKSHAGDEQGNAQVEVKAV